MSNLSNELAPTERLQKIASWREKYGNDHNVMIPAKEAELIVSELLAYREAAKAEPVAWMVGDATLYNPDTVEAYVKRSGLPVIPLFTAPQLPAVPPELTKVKLHEIWDEKLDKGERFNDSFREGYEYCRAITLAAAPNHSEDNLEKVNSPVIPDCWCHECQPVTMSNMRFVVCPECGNKRCPRANDHRNACTGSNESGQEGSAYPAAPKPEV